MSSKGNGPSPDKTQQSWHRHPLAISAFSIIFGSLGVGLLQNSIAEKKAIREKRYVVAEKLMRYIGQTGTTLRLYDRAAEEASNAREFPMKPGTHRPAQESLNATFELQNQLQVELAFFFSSKKPLEAFERFRIAFESAINSAETARKSGKYGSHTFASYTADLGEKGSACICAMKGDLPISDIGAGRCPVDNPSKK